MNPPVFSENYEVLKAAARDAPLDSGVYLWRDEENRIIYIGKAKVLRNRLNSYFAKTQDLKTRALLKHAKSIETIITPNEYEALLLEHTLIKQHFPKYNINLKDGKTYPMIRITAENFPRVFKTRHIVEDGSHYFGPYPQVGAVDALLELIDKLFFLRKCRILRKRAAPCMYYHIGRCKGPCCNKISREEYGEQLQRIRRLLSGESQTLVVELTALMHEEAKALRFEQAVLIRDAVKAIENLSESSSVIDLDPEGRDYIAWAAEGIFTTFTVFSMRGGKLVGRELFRTHSAAEEEESLETFISVYYTQDRPPPPYIYAATGKKDEEKNLSQWFLKHFGYEPALLPPREKRHEAVLAMARQNALEDLRRRLKERGNGPALDELSQTLSLRTRPERIEGFDIAQLEGKYPVASLISFKNGVPDRKNYRYFRLRTVVGAVDDFGAIREAVRRRYARLLREHKDLPDLILIDGGIGQVNAAKGILRELGLNIDAVGLAKRNEELWLPHSAEPIRLSKRSEALKLLQFIRDETHRFATSLNQRLRSEAIAFSVLESVEGVGPKRAGMLMKAFEDLSRIATAETADIMRRGKLKESIAKAVKTAVALALEDRQTAMRYKPYHTGESLAAEAAIDYLDQG
jgi:excinuclease ABC subunit C